MKMEEDRLTIAVIIPNEEILNIEDFYDECRTNERHHEDMIRDFIKKNKDNSKPVFNNISYTNIENYKNGVKLNVNPNETISVITSGIVVYIGEKEELGNTIIIQGNDGVDIWYSNLTDTNIKVYDYIESGTILGTSNSNEVYLTLLKDGKYMNYEEYIKSL